MIGVSLIIVIIIIIILITVRLSKLTLLPDEDLQCAAKCCDQYQSDNRETNNKTKPFIHIIHDD